jgi:hypothetical protein
MRRSSARRVVRDRHVLFGRDVDHGGRLWVLILGRPVSFLGAAVGRQKIAAYVMF